MAWGKNRSRKDGPGGHIVQSRNAWIRAKRGKSPYDWKHVVPYNNNSNGTSYGNVNRVVNSLVCLWWFDEVSNTIVDRTPATTNTSLDWITAQGGQWSQDAAQSDRWYLNLSGGGQAKTDTPSEPISRVQSTNQLTIEAWVSPTEADGLATSGPGRVIALSNVNNPYSNQSFMLGHGTWTGNASHNASNYTARVKVDGNTVSLWSGDNTASATIQHLALTCSASPSNVVDIKFYLDGNLVDSYSNTVSNSNIFSQFSNASVLSIGSEIDGEKKAPGGYYLGAIYDRALTQQEVQTNFNDGVVPISNGHSVPQIVTINVPDEVTTGEEVTGVVGVGGTRNGNIELFLGMSGPGTQYGTDYTINGSAVPPSIIIPKDQDTATFSVSSSPAVASDKVALIMVSGATGGSIVSQPGVNLSEDSLNIITNSIKPEVGFDYTSNPQAYPAGGPETKELFSVKNSRLFNSNVEVFLSGSSESTNTGTYSFVSGNGDIVDLSTGMNFIVSSNQQIGQVNINCVSDTVPEDPIYKAARLPGRMGLWYYPPANRWWLAENPSSQSDEMDSGILMQQANIDMLLRTTNTNSADPDLPHSDSEIQGYFDQGFTFLGVKSPFIDERGTDGKRINDDWPVSGTYVGQDGTTPKSVEYWMLNHEAEFHTVAPWDNYYNLEYNSLSSYSSGDRVWVDDTSYNYAGSDRTRLIVFEASATVTPGQLPQFTPGTISNILSTPLNGNGWTRVWNSHTNSYLSVKKGLDMTVDSVRAGADSFKAEWPDKKLYYFFGKGVCVAGFNGNGANTRPDIVLNDGTVLEDQLSWFSSVAAIDSFDGFLFDYYPFNSKPQGASYYKNADPPASYLHPLLNIWVVDNDAKWVVSGVHRIKEWSQSAEFPNGKPVYPTLAATPNFVSSINTTTLANGGDYTDGGKLAAYHQDTPTYLENYNLAVSCLDAGADGIIWYTHTWKRKTFNSGNGSYQSGYAGPEASFWPICHKVWRSSSSNGQGQFNDPITDPLTGQWVNLHQLYFPNHPNVDLSGDGTLENMVAVSNYVKNYFIGSTGDANNFPDGDSLSAVILSASVDGGVYDNDVLDVCSTLSDAGAYFVQAALPPPPGNFNVNNTSQIVSWQGAETSATTGPRIATVLHPYHSNVQFVNPGEGNSTNKIEVPSGGLIVSGQLFTNVKLSTTNNLRFVDCTFSGQQDFHNGISQWYTVQEITANSGRNELVDFEYCHLTGGKNTVYSTFRSMHKCSLYHVLSDHLRLKTSTVGYTLTNCWLGSYQDAEDSILNNFSGMYDSNSGVHADPEMVQASNGAIKKLIFRSCNFQGRDSFWSDGTYRADSHKGGSLLASVLVKVDFDEIVFDDCVMYGGGHYFLQVNINSLPNTPRTVTISNCRIGTSLTSNIISIQDSQGSITKIMHSNNWLDTGTPVCKLPAEAISQGVTTSNNGVNLDVNDVLKGVDSVSFNGLGMNVLGNTPWGKRSTPI